jgi:hypothetical protein
MKKMNFAVIFIVALLALILSGAFYIHLANTLTIPPKAKISIEVVYAYVGQPTANSEAGLDYTNSQTNQAYELSSYIFVLKVTNNGAQMISLTQFRVYLAQQITENQIGLNDSYGNPAPGGLGGPSFEIKNTIISDTRTGLQSSGFSNYLDAGKSRLIALTGIVSLDSFSLQYLHEDTLSIWGSVTGQTGYASGQSAWSDQSTSANDVRQVALQEVGGDYLYNALLSQNQTLTINGLDTTVNSKN